MERDLKELCRKRRIERWWVVGPFPAETVEGASRPRSPLTGDRFPEGVPGFEKKPGSEIKAVKWKRAGTSSATLVNFREAFDPHEHAAAYAYVSVEARRPVRTAILVTAKCGLEVRLNSRTSTGRSPARTTRTRTRARTTCSPLLRAGPTTSSSRAWWRREWGFALRIVDPVGDLRISSPDPAAPAQRGFEGSALWIAGNLAAVSSDSVPVTIRSKRTR